MSSKTKTVNKSSYSGSFVQNYGVYIFLIVIYVLNLLFTNRFASMNTFWLIWAQACPTILCALGMTFIISTGGIDISIGSAVAFGGTLCAQLYIAMGLPLFLAVAVGILGCLLVGLFNGFIVARFNVPPIVVTLISMMAFRGVAQTITGGKPVSFAYTPLNTIANFRFWKQGMPLQFLIIVGVTLLFCFLAKKTVFGRQVQAVGENRTAARLAGINVYRLTLGVYALCGLILGLSSIIEVGRLGQSNPAVFADGAEMDAIAAVAVGGTSLTGGKARMLGSVAGALIMQLVSMTVNYHGWNSSWGDVLKAAILILAVCLQSVRKKS